MTNNKNYLFILLKIPYLKFRAKIWKAIILFFFFDVCVYCCVRNLGFFFIYFLPHMPSSWLTDSKTAFSFLLLPNLGTSIRLCLKFIWQVSYYVYWTKYVNIIISLQFWAKINAWIKHFQQPKVLYALTVENELLLVIISDLSY